MSTVKRLIGVALAVALGCNSIEPDYSSSGFVGRAPVSSSSSGFIDPAPQRSAFCDGVSEGAPCIESSSTAQACERGTSANYACNGRLECQAEGDHTSRREWRFVPAARDDCRTDCPAAYTETFAGCTGANAGSLQCDYDEGFCGCAPVAKQQNDGGLAGDAGDAGDAGAPAYAWRCTKPTSSLDGGAGCPRRRPREGEECVREMTCDYGACIFEDGYRMGCYRKAWVRDISRSTQCDR